MVLLGLAELWLAKWSTERVIVAHRSRKVSPRIRSILTSIDLPRPSDIEQTSESDSHHTGIQPEGRVSVVDGVQLQDRVPDAENHNEIASI